jgi:hypothetical protein
MTQLTKPTEKFTDLAELDARIPPNMMMKYQGKDYILKAGLEYKASQVFGPGKYSIHMEIVDRTDDRIVVKATMIIVDGGTFENFGECNKLNTPPNMAKYALHLATTRAECRVLRMATACGYVAFEEMETTNGDKEIVADENDGKPATAQQLAVLKGLGAKDEEIADLTQGQAKQNIASATAKGKDIIWEK